MPSRKKARSKPTGTLAAMIEPRKRGDTLLSEIQTHVMKKAAQPSDRRDDVIHPSELAKADVCPRKIVYRISGAPKDFNSEIHGIALQTIFQEGHDSHHKYQTWLQEMGILWGKWRCASCGLQKTGLSADLPRTLDSHHHIWKYLEVPIDGMNNYLIHGHADGAVRDTVIEVKTIGLGTLRMEEPDLVRQHTVKTVDGKSVADYDGLWKSLSRPLVSHRKQAGLYLRLLQEQGLPFETVTFIYENKANQQVKQFVTKVEDYLVDPMLETAKDIKWAVDNERLLPIPIDLEADSKMCRSCEWRTTCRGTADAPQDEQDAGVGPGEPGGEEETRTPEDLPPRSSGRRSARSTGRSDRDDRERTDESVHGDHEVDRVRRQPTRDSRGRREVRRVSRGEGQGRPGH